MRVCLCIYQCVCLLVCVFVVDMNVPRRTFWPFLTKILSEMALEFIHHFIACSATGGRLLNSWNIQEHIKGIFYQLIGRNFSQRLNTCFVFFLIGTKKSQERQWKQENKMWLDSRQLSTFQLILILLGKMLLWVFVRIQIEFFISVIYIRFPRSIIKNVFEWMTLLGLNQILLIGATESQRPYNKGPHYL